MARKVGCRGAGGLGCVGWHRPRVVKGLGGSGGGGGLFPCCPCIRVCCAEGSQGHTGYPGVAGAQGSHQHWLGTAAGTRLLSMAGVLQCAMLNEKLDSLVRELNEEAQAIVLPEGVAPATPADTKDQEKGGSFNPSPVPRIFKSKEQLMLRANSLKKALRQIIEQTEKGEGVVGAGSLRGAAAWHGPGEVGAGPVPWFPCLSPWGGSSAGHSKGISPSLMLGVAGGGSRRGTEVPPWALPGWGTQG